MKKMLFAIGVLGVGLVAGAQQKSKKNPPSVVTQRHKIETTKPVKQQPAVNLLHTGRYAAKAGNGVTNLYIADPVIRAFNMRSNGANIRLSGSGVLGAPRGTYGFANGQISLRTTDATSIGGITGSGSVGTGSSAGGVGTAGMAPLVNGKNVYAGPSIWGSARNMQLPDSVLRRRNESD
jgi:hypothetical protein